MGRRCITKYLGTPSVKSYNSLWQHWKLLFVISSEYTEQYLLLRRNVWECVACRVIEIRRMTASNYVEMRGAAASSCMEMRGNAARKCVEMCGTAGCVVMRVARTPPNRGSSARDANGKHAGTAAQVRLKRVEPRFQALVGPVFIRDRHVKG